MLLGVVARAFRRVAAAAGFEFKTALGSPTATVAYQGQPASVDVETALGSPFGAKGHQGSANAYAFDAALGSPTAVTGKTGNPDAFAIVTGMGSPTATVDYQGSPAAVETVFEFPSISVVSLDADAQAIIDEMTTAPSSARETAINDLVVGLKDDGIWSKLDRLWVMAAHDAQAARLDWKNPATSGNALTEVNSPTFTADQGYTGNGSSSYLNTNFTPSADASQFALNSASAGVWVRNVGSDQTGFYLGTRGTINSSQIFIFRIAAGAWQLSGVNSSSGWAGSTSAQNADGLLVINRSGASANQSFIDGSQETTSSNSSGTLSDREVFLLARNNQGTPASLHDGQISIAFIGASLSATEHSNLHSRLNTYMGAL